MNSVIPIGQHQVRIKSQIGEGTSLAPSPPPLLPSSPRPLSYLTRLGFMLLQSSFQSPSPTLLAGSLAGCCRCCRAAGGYSYVYLVEDVSTGEEFALKRMLAQVN